MEYLKLKRICQLENQIRQIINEDNGANCHFFYDQPSSIEADELFGVGEAERKKTVLTLVTSNPRHQELFTLYSTDPQDDQVSCLDQTITYLNQIKKKDNDLSTYQVVWYSDETPTRQISFFYAKDVPEVVSRFFDGKDKSLFNIVSIEMRPSS